MKTIIALGFALLSSVPLDGQDIKELARLQLNNRCQPMGLSVGLGQAERLGVSRAMVRAAIERRLRSSDLSLDAGYGSRRKPSMLLVAAERKSQGFKLTLAFLKRLRDDFDNAALSYSWMQSVEVNYHTEIIQNLGELMDSFLKPYLQANANDCVKRRLHEGAERGQ